MKKLHLSLPKIFIVILSIELIHISALPRMRKMLVRRKIPIDKSRNSNNSTVEERQIIKPIKIVKRKLIHSSSPPVLSSPLLSESPTTTSPLPQHKPFTINETVAAKPDAVKRCKEITKCKMILNLEFNFSFIPIHNCVMETGTLYINSRNQWNMLLIK